METAEIDAKKFGLELEKTVNDTQQIIVKEENKKEWLGRYSGYVKALSAKMDSIKTNSKYFHEWAPLYFYLSISNAKIAKTTLTLDVRYRGQKIATLKSKKSSVTISTKVKVGTNWLFERNNRDFNCNIELDNDNWRSEKAKQFRQHFSKNPPRNNTKNNKSNEEHNIESLLVTELSKKSSVDKQILNVQTVDFENFRVSVKTPISASKKNGITYSGHKGGSIDILARTGRGRGTYLTVIEVKDENNNNEPPKTALKQAIRYSVFIRELLRSEIGNAWYELFGFGREVPKSQLTIRVACAMPDNNSDKSFANLKLPVGNDVLECHFIYFKYDKENNKLTNFQTSLKR